MIDVHQLVVRQGNFRLDDISFQVPSGQYAVLTGKTGSGKTTLLECLCGLRPIAAGTVRLGDRDVTRLSPRARDIGYVPQDGALFPNMSVAQQLTFPLKLRRWPREKIRARTDELADLLGIRPLLARAINGLSGGEVQRIALGRALSFGPRILLLDEPLSALDADTCAAMCVLLENVHRQSGVTVLHATHRFDEVKRLAQLEWQLNDGSIRCHQTFSP